MPQNFIDCDREQEFLLPPSLREWLADDHLAWFVADAVEEMDLAAFYGVYRSDGLGSCRLRAEDDGLAPALRLRGRRALLPRHRTTLPRGCRLPRPLR